MRIVEERHERWLRLLHAATAASCVALVSKSETFLTSAELGGAARLIGDGAHRTAEGYRGSGSREER